MDDNDNKHDNDNYHDIAEVKAAIYLAFLQARNEWLDRTIFRRTGTDSTV